MNPTKDFFRRLALVYGRNWRDYQAHKRAWPTLNEHTNWLHGRLVGYRLVLKWARRDNLCSAGDIRHGVNKGLHSTK